MTKNNLQDEFAEILAKYIPQKAIPQIVDWLIAYRVHLAITEVRKTKHGDYRHPHLGKGHRISVNSTLNQYAFLVTLVHEFAHLFVYENHENKVEPHGKEWKNAFKKALKPFIDAAIFPTDLSIALLKHLNDPPASSSMDLNLLKTLKKYDKGNEQGQKLLLEELPYDTKFYFQERLFVKKEKLRLYFRCEEMKTKKTFKIHPLVEVNLLEK